MTLLNQAVIFLGAALILVPLAKRLGLNTVLGYLMTGILLGPFGFNVAGNPVHIMHFAEFGVVLLLFLIGLELQPARLWALRRSLFLVGGLQVLLTGLLLTALIWFLLQRPVDSSFVIGFGLAFSSTAFVMQLLAENQQLGSLQGRRAFAVLLFQDMAVIPLLAILPLISGARQAHFDLRYVLSLLAIFTGLILASRFVVRPFFRFVASSGARELLTAIALFLVIGVSVLMQTVGISMALGAFLAGVLLADSEFRHDLEASIEPFKGLLLGLFFMSVGMSVRLDVLTTQPVFILAGTLGLMLIKFGIMTAIARFIGIPWLTSLRIGVLLSQGGEFAFVLFSTAIQQQVLAEAVVTPLILMVTLSMALTPLAYWIVERKISPWLERKTPSREYDQIPESEHPVIIAGFGRVGQIVGRVLRMHGIEFTAIEKSVRQVDFVRKYGNTVYYGDPTSPELLHAAGIEHTRLFVLALDDVEESIKTAAYLHARYPNLPLLVRARDRHHYYRLRDIGITLIWRETYLSALAMAESALTQLGLEESDARDSVRTFFQYDQRLMARQQAIYADETSLIESNKAAMAELEGLFETDFSANKGAASASSAVPDSGDTSGPVFGSASASATLPQGNESATVKPKKLPVSLAGPALHRIPDGLDLIGQSPTVSKAPDTDRD